MYRIAMSDERLARYAGEEAAAGGRQYARENRVFNLSLLWPELAAEVEGPGREPFRVVVTLAEQNAVWVPQKAECSCPSPDMWCKHAVAVVLTARDDPEQILQRQPLITTIRQMTLAQAQDFLVSLAAVPAVREQMERMVPPQPRKYSDVAAVRDLKEAVSQARDSLRDLINPVYHDGIDLPGALRPVLESAEELLEDGKAGQAAAQLLALTGAYLDVWTIMDDSDGDASGFVDEISPALAEAILLAELTETERGEFAPQLRKWAKEAQDYGVETLQAAWQAAERGPEAARALASLQEPLDEAGQVLALAWLAVLDKREQHHEFLAFAESLQKYGLYAAQLAKMGRVAEAVEYARTHINDSAGAVAALQSLWDYGAHQEAVQLGLELARRLPTETQSIASVVAGYADLRGDEESALAAYLLAFQHFPAVEHYERIKDLAGDQWPELSERLWQRLRQRNSSYAALRIFLQERMTADIIASCEGQEAWMDSGLLEEAAETVLSEEPEWVIRMLSRQAEAIIEAKQSTRYRRAARFLALVKKAYLAKGDAEGWAAYKAAITAAHQRKYALMPLIAAL